LQTHDPAAGAQSSAPAVQPAVVAAQARQDDGGLVEKAPAGARWTAGEAVKGRLLRRLLYGAMPEPVPSQLGLVEDPEPGKLGICCSGGGIRSAAFNLGALQWLQKEEQLQTASYLAAVSGGSYIASAISMVAKTWRVEEAQRDEERKPRPDDSNPACFDKLAPFDKGSPEEQYLRNRSSYMAPDSSSLVYVVLRALLGLAFNLLFVSLPLFALGLLCGDVLYRPHFTQLVGECAKHMGGCKADVGWWWIMPTGALALSAALALAGMLLRTRDNGGKLLAIWSVRLLYFAVLLAVLLLLVPTLVDVLRHRTGEVAAGSSGAPSGVGAIGGGAGVAGLVLGVVSQLRQALASPKKAYEDLQKGSKWLRSLSSGARLAIAYVAGGLIGPVLIAGVYVFGVSVSLANSNRGGVHGWVLMVAGAAAGLFVVLYLFADITSWSLHPFYKRRLCSAFALKRVFPSDLGKRERARFEALRGAGEDAAEEPIAVERNYDRLVKLSDSAVQGRKWPTLLVCAAANISDTAATPPGRKVTSFTFSAHTVGGPLVGALPTTELEEAFERHGGMWGKVEDWGDRQREKLGMKRKRTRVSDFSLPAAVAMSGAAISPSMGKLTRRPFTFLLALANIRLGVWVPNPRWVAAPGPPATLRFGRPRPLYLFREMLGLNQIGARYLYVTDGGHYENLGLVELLRRGCRKIYCFDASGGEGFASLGDAIALARSELGVEIGDIQPEPLFPEQAGDLAKKMAVSIDFSYPGDGLRNERCRLVYARNVLTPLSPWDAQAHHKADPNFPHNSTVDQLYTDQKFEGYRVLGERAGQAAIACMRAPAAPPSLAPAE